eukprot:Lankesteria_metandrocarpae@DN4875_c0_g1_i1.p1
MGITIDGGGCWLYCRPHQRPNSKKTANQYICCGIISLLLPGFGAMIMACIEGDSKFFWIGLAQLVTALIIFGWIWSFIYGLYMIGAGCKYL